MATKQINTEIAYKGECFDIISIPDIDLNQLEIAYKGEVYSGYLTQAIISKMYVVYNTIQKIGILTDLNNKVLLKK